LAYYHQNAYCLVVLFGGAVRFASDVEISLLCLTWQVKNIDKEITSINAAIERNQGEATEEQTARLSTLVQRREFELRPVSIRL
jgi:hypothetical protein